MIRCKPVLTCLLGIGSLVLTPALIPAIRAAAPVVANTSTNADDVFARGKNVLVKRGELEDVFKRLEVELLNTGRFIPPEERDFRRAVLLDRMIFNRLVISRATNADRQTAEETSSKFIKELIEQLGTPEALQRQLARSGMDEAYFRKVKLEEATVLAVINREVRSKIQPPAADVEKYYSEYNATFQRKETYKIAHILIGTRDNVSGQDLTAEQKSEKRRVAETILGKIKQGEDFAELVKKHSDDYKSRSNEGVLVFTQGQALAELEVAAATLNPGQLSDVVSTPFGYHILRLIEKTPGGKIPFTEAEPDIRKVLVDRELEKRLPAWADELNAEAKIEVTDLAPKKPDFKKP